MRTFATLLVLAFLLLGQTRLALALDTGKSVYVDNRGFPGDSKASEMYSALYSAADGTVYIGLCTGGGSAQFYSYDPHSDRMRHIADMAEFLGQAGKGIREAGKIHTPFVEDSEGRIYFATMNEDVGPPNIDPNSWEGPNWIRYDPKTDQLENLGLIDRHWGVYGFAIDRNRNRLFATAWNGHLYRFDIDTRKTVDLGRVENWDDPRSIVADDRGNVYGPYVPAGIWKYDAATERVYNLSVRTPYDPLVYPISLSDPMLDRKDMWRVAEWDPVDHVIYGVENGGSILFRYDPYDGAEGKVTVLEKLCAQRYYASHRKDIPSSTLAFTIGKDRKIYYAPSGIDFDYEARLEGARLIQKSDGLEITPYSELIVYDLKSGKRTNLGTLKTRDGRRVFGCEGAAAGPDGTIYLCCAAEVRDPQQAAGKVAGIYPFVMQLLIYRPQGR
jgi:hypothetical protein